MKNAKLIVKTSLAMSLLALVLFSLSTARTVGHLRSAITDGLDSEIAALTAIVPQTLAVPMYNFAYDRLDELVDVVFANENVVGVRVFESSELITERIQPDLDPSMLITIDESVSLRDGSGEEVELGTMEMIFTRAAIQTAIESEMRDSIAQSIVILLALVVLNAIVLFRVVVRPIKTTSDRMQEIAEGESDLSNRLEVTSGDEVGQLALHFNTFLNSLDGLVTEIRAGMNGNLQVQNDLASNTEETVAAIEQMTANIESTKRQMNNLSTVIASSDETVYHIIQQNGRTLEYVETQGTMVEQTSASVTQLLASIENVNEITRRQSESATELVEIARSGSERLEQTSTVIASIEEDIGNIREFLALINDIAARTNLLAMNAAIEAAHAGDAGRGFAVVAQEIRKLSESAGSNAKTISKVLEDTISSIQNASELSTRTTESFGEIDTAVQQTMSSFKQISNAMNEMNSGSKEIHDAVGNLNNVSQELVKDGRKMQEGSAKLKTTMDEIGDVSRVVDSAMTEIRVGTDEINNAMGQIASITHVLGNTSGELASRISRFKTSEQVDEVT